MGVETEGILLDFVCIDCKVVYSMVLGLFYFFCSSYSRKEKVGERETKFLVLFRFLF